MTAIQYENMDKSNPNFFTCPILCDKEAHRIDSLFSEGPDRPDSSTKNRRYHTDSERPIAPYSRPLFDVHATKPYTLCLNIRWTLKITGEEVCHDRGQSAYGFVVRLFFLLLVCIVDVSMEEATSNLHRPAVDHSQSKIAVT